MNCESSTNMHIDEATKEMSSIIDL